MFNDPEMSTSFLDECQIQSNSFCTAPIKYIPARRYVQGGGLMKSPYHRTGRLSDQLNILSIILLKSNRSDISKIDNLFLLSLNCLFVLK